MSTSNHTSNIPYGYCQCGCGQETTLSGRNTRNVKRGEPNKFVLGHSNREHKKQPIENRFWSKVAITANPDKCWEWQYFRNENNYGQSHKDGRNMLTHRIAWELTYGEIPDGLWVLHKCDNPPCCNPAHLFLGTHQDNMQDMATKGRSNPPGLQGEKHARHKLTDYQVREIRQRYRSGSIEYMQLAHEYGVSFSTINRVINHKGWKHIP